MIKIENIIKSFSGANVEYVIVGEVAVFIHGWETISAKLEIAYSRKNENLIKIVDVLSKFSPGFRGLSEKLPFTFDISTLQNEINFTFETDIGDIDLLGEVAGVGSYEEVEANSVIMNLYGFDVHVLSLEGLIKAKRAAGRTKDLLVLPELEALREALSDEE